MARTNRARLRPITPACAPTGDLSAWPAERYRCADDSCGADLHAVRAAPLLNDWAYATATGERYRDDAPPALREDPVKWWDDLRARMADGDMVAAQLYSSLSARLSLNALAFLHAHRPGERIDPRPDREPPFCCGWPMWASPDGWACRKAKTLVAYAAPTAPLAA